VVLLLLLSLAYPVQALWGHRKVDIDGQLVCKDKRGVDIPIEDAIITLYELDKPWSTEMSTAKTSPDGEYKLHGEDIELYGVEFWLKIRVPCSKSSKTRQNCVGTAYQKVCERNGEDTFFEASYEFEAERFDGNVFSGFSRGGEKLDSYKLKCTVENNVGPAASDGIRCGGGTCVWDCLEEQTPFYNSAKKWACFRGAFYTGWPWDCRVTPGIHS
ncbi:hypothetical protein PENTCL1PPCAC_22025, partial [Pristionchus entomophagus]